MKEFYERHTTKRNVVCAECGKAIFEVTASNIAHILPKTVFKSVAQNDNNFMYLCLAHHAQFDTSFRNAQKMKCWNEALRKYNLFKDEVTEYHNILNFFN